MVSVSMRLVVATAVVATHIGQKPVIIPPPNIYGEFKPTPGVEAPAFGITGVFAETNATPRVVSIDAVGSLQPDARRRKMQVDTEQMASEWLTHPTTPDKEPAHLGSTQAPDEAAPPAATAEPGRHATVQTFSTPMSAGPVVGREAEDHDTVADWVETFQTDMAGVVEHMRLNGESHATAAGGCVGGKSIQNNCNVVYFRNDVVQKITPSWFMHPFSFLASDAKALLDISEKGQHAISKAVSGAVVGIVVMALVLVVLSYAWRQRMNRHEDAAVRIQAAYRGSTERTSILSAVTSVDAPGDRSPLTDDR